MSTNEGDNAWVLMSSCLVMFMTPGVGFFYGGMVNKKNMLNTIVYCLLTFSVTTITWALLGFSLAFGDKTAATGFIGDCKYCGLRNILFADTNEYASTIPLITFFVFQTMFASVCPAIVVGSIVGRIKMSFILIWTVCFNVIVYAPIAFWVWNH